MKHFILSLIVILAAGTTSSMAQEDTYLTPNKDTKEAKELREAERKVNKQAEEEDDLYFSPKKESKEEKAQRKAEFLADKEAKKQAKKDKEIFELQAQLEMEQRAYNEMLVRLYRRLYHDDVDIYNRHFTYENPDTIYRDSLNNDFFSITTGTDDLYDPNEDFRYYRTLSRFDYVMLDIDAMSGVPYWFAPWYISPTRINLDWVFPSPRFSNPFSPGWWGAIYNPWYYGYIRDPWYYGFHRDPWWYTWYDPYTDGYYGWNGIYGMRSSYNNRPYYENYYVPNYGYVGTTGHQRTGNHNSGSGTRNHGSGSYAYGYATTSTSKWGVRTTTNISDPSGWVPSRSSGNNRYSGYSDYNSSSGPTYTSPRYNGTTSTFTPASGNSSYGSTRSNYSSSSSSYSSSSGGYGSSSSYSSFNSGSSSSSSSSSRSSSSSSSSVTTSTPNNYSSSGSAAGSYGARGAGGRR